MKVRDFKDKTLFCIDILILSFRTGEQLERTVLIRDDSPYLDNEVKMLTVGAECKNLEGVKMVAMNLRIDPTLILYIDDYGGTTDETDNL